MTFAQILDRKSGQHHVDIYQTVLRWRLAILLFNNTGISAEALPKTLNLRF